MSIIAHHHPMSWHCRSAVVPPPAFRGVRQLAARLERA
jgi:hypothetical protein